MARARNIKPSFFTNEELSELDFFDRLLFIGLWTLTDKRGVFENRPKRIRAQLFPYDDITVARVEQGLRELDRLKFLVLYEASPGPALGYVLNFEKHQHPHHREKDNGFSLPIGDILESPGPALGLPQSSPSENGILNTENGILNTENGNLKDETGTPGPAIDATLTPPPKSEPPVVEAQTLIKLYSGCIKITPVNSANIYLAIQALENFTFDQIRTAIEEAGGLYRKDNTPAKFRKGWKAFSDPSNIKLLLGGEYAREMDDSASKGQSKKYQGPDMTGVAGGRLR
jgi:hypothetical protein